ncbi:hypothetical protein SRHO_G00305510 [Serrasalmus rhombeus]
MEGTGAARWSWLSPSLM